MQRIWRRKLRIVQIEIIDFDQLAANLHRADVISSCTGSLHQVIHYLDVKAALKKRRYQQMLLVDLAVPRDIDPKVEKLDGVYLYGVDDLQSVIDENLAQRRQAAVEAEVMVNQLATELITQQKLRKAGSTIHAYRDYGESLCQEELATAMQRIAKGESAETVLAEFSHRLTQNFCIPPQSCCVKLPKLKIQAILKCYRTVCRTWFSIAVRLNIKMMSG